MTIGDRIRERRIALGFTQQELAERLGYKSKASIAKIESGVTDIAQARLPEFAKVLRTDVGYLLGLGEPPPANPILSLVQRINDRLETATPEELETVYRIVLAVLGEEDK